MVSAVSQRDLTHLERSPPGRRPLRGPHI